MLRMHFQINHKK